MKASKTPAASAPSRGDGIQRRGSARGSSSSPSEALRSAFLSLDTHLQLSVATDPSPSRQKMFDTCGSTAVAVFITQDEVVVASLGDSRAVLCRDYQAVPLTKDHKPSNLEEADRIIKAGGSVQRGRINGNLAVSRSFGDFYYKNDSSRPQDSQMVSPVPNITETPISLDPRTSSDQFIIIACDGVWDVVTEQDACYLVSEMLGEGKDVEDVCRKFLDYCLLANSKDNMTVVICVFPKGRECEVGSYRRAPRLEEALKVKDNLAHMNSHVERQKNSINKSISQSRRASMQVFEGLKVDDGVIKIAARAATHSDEVLRLHKDLVVSWNEEEVVDKFLRLCELDEYGDNFIEEGVDGKVRMDQERRTVCVIAQ